MSQIAGGLPSSSLLKEELLEITLFFRSRQHPRCNATL
jgi:hypothetical protein